MSNADDLLPSVPFTYFGICKTCHSQFLSTNVAYKKGAAHFYLCGTLFHRHYFIKSNP